MERIDDVVVVLSDARCSKHSFTRNRPITNDVTEIYSLGYIM